MITKIKFIILIIFLTSCTTKINTNSFNNSQKSENDSLNKNVEFKEALSSVGDFPDSIKTKIKNNLNLSEVSLLGEINTGKMNWYIIKGFIDGGTFQDLSLYLFPNFKTNIPDSIIKQKYSLPGKEYSYDNELIFKSRVFVGNCTEKFNQSLIWCQFEKCDRKWIQNYFIIQFHEDTLETFRLNKEDININEIIENLKVKKCIELEGVDTYEEL